jgi:hypothetical protein
MWMWMLILEDECYEERQETEPCLQRILWYLEIFQIGGNLED